MTGQLREGGRKWGGRRTAKDSRPDQNRPVVSLWTSTRHKTFASVKNNCAMSYLILSFLHTPHELSPETRNLWRDCVSTPRTRVHITYGYTTARGGGGSDPARTEAENKLMWSNMSLIFSSSSAEGLFCVWYREWFMIQRCVVQIKFLRL